MTDQTEYDLSEARNGDSDGADRSLNELPNDRLPELVEAYRREADPEIRALIVEAVWQHRQPTSVGFLCNAWAIVGANRRARDDQ